MFELDRTLVLRYNTRVTVTLPGYPEPIRNPYPELSEYSENDWNTGWIFPEIRQYAWRIIVGFDKTHSGFKHAIRKPVSLFGGIVSECGSAPALLGEWRGTRTSEDRIRFFSAKRCPDCLKAIDAPKWKPVTHRPRRTKRSGDTPFGQFSMAPPQPETLRAREIYGGTG